MHLRRPYLNIRALTVFLIAAVPLLALGLMLVLSNAQAQLRESFGRQLEQAAERTAAAVDAYVYRRIIDVSLLARLPELRDAAGASTRAPYDARKVAELDRAWSASRAVPPALASDAPGLRVAPSARHRRAGSGVPRDSPDRPGADVLRRCPACPLTTTRRTRTGGARRSTRARWAASRSATCGGTKARRVYALEIAAPVPETSGAGTAGILKVVADVRELLAAVAGGSGDADADPEGRLDRVQPRAPAPGGRFFANDGLQAHLARASDGEPRLHFVASHPDGRQLVGIAPSQLGLSYPNLTWFVAVWQAEEELLAPLRTQLWQWLFLLALTGAIVLALALWFSMRLIAPPTDTEMQLVEHAKLPRLEEREAEEPVATTATEPPRRVVGAVPAFALSRYGEAGAIGPYDSVRLGRKFAARIFFRRRMLFGVTSTSSSSLMNSIACSRPSFRGGMRRTASSAVDARMLVCFFSFVTFTSRSFGARVLADDHALVDLRGGLDEDLAALLEVRDRVRGRGPGPVGDERPGRP